MRPNVLLSACALLVVAGCGGNPEPAPVNELPAASVPVAAPVVEPLAAPERVEIPSLGVVDELKPVGLAPDRTMEIPPVDQIGWYEPGVPIGAPGPAVLAGHVNYEGVPGAFARLGELKIGDDIVVVDGERRLTYDVYEVRQFPKAAFDFQFVFADRAGSELVAVTCSGDVVGRSYTHNTAVAARLVQP